MITTLFVESDEPLVCAAGMPLCGGTLTGVYFGDLRGYPWHSLDDAFPPDMEAVVLIVQYGDQQELRIGHMGYEGFFIDEETGACLEDEDGQVTHWCHLSALTTLQTDTVTVPDKKTATAVLSAEDIAAARLLGKTEAEFLKMKEEMQ